MRSHAAELKAKGITSGPIGRVERFFLCLDEIYAPEQRLRSIQVTQQFDERAERLLAHASSLQNACKQLKESVKLRPHDGMLNKKSVWKPCAVYPRLKMT